MLTPGIVLITFFFLLPLTLMVIYSFYTRVLGGSIEPIFTLDNYLRALTRPLYLKIIFRTLWLALVTTIITLVLSYPLSYFLARTKSKHKNLLVLAVLFPFWTSIIIRSYAWLVLLGNKGVVNSVLAGLGLPKVQLIWNETGVLFGLVQILLPYMILPLYASISGIKESIEESARTLGAGSLVTFMRMTVPLSLPGAATGALLVFISAMGSFLTPALLGGPSQIVIPMLIYEQIAILNYAFAAALSMILVFIVLIIVILFDRLVGLERLGGIYG
ncbi:MAG: hypothetical protein A2X25_02315 [Chloroflexi bacterium GWB2_49_20]|nr:MAG: hypothetical protein A2X25_02315 [Chloroflexi bacterium GWB2_49_20]OGN79689.1 MAG: hypothetical protein A2X26_07295 [Chloroflexi bacterium GWC2_49_37]OGN85937.1 MAG: hypothetical protein A2X27_00055 [Chloroflexi bacterium GWD2_49_16]